METGSKLTAFIAIIICIFTMGSSIYIYSLLTGERDLREKAEEELGSVKAELGLIKKKNTQIANDLKEAQSLAARVVDEKRIINERVDELEEKLRSAEAATDEAAKLPDRLAKVTADKEEIEGELKAIREEKARLEIELKKKTGELPGGSVDVGTVDVHTGRRFSGKVLVVNKKYSFVVIDIGKEHGMEVGVDLILHRGTKFLGKVAVEKVYERMSAATLMIDWMKDEPHVGDGVKKY